MKESEQKQMDLFLKKTIKHLEFEQVPPEFTGSVMAKLEQFQIKSQKTAYRPLISKPAWYAMVLVVIGVGIFLGSSAKIESSEWFSVIKLNIIGSTNFLSVLQSLTISDTAVYGLAGLLIFIVIQIVYLRRFFATRRVII
jgi:hypothetical protein